MLKKLLVLSTLIITVIVFNACQDSTNPPEFQAIQPILPEQSHNYVEIWDKFQNFRLPESIPTSSGEVFIEECIGCPTGTSIFNHQNVVESNEIATLGRVLFYDPNLSINKSISCASCHKQTAAFADTKALSDGFAGKETHRNSMSLANPVLNTNFFWDSRTPSLKSLISEPIQNHIELGFDDLSQLVERLENIDYYPELFMRAYGSPNVTKDRIDDAVAQFVGSMFSGDSRFDKAVEDDFTSFTEVEKHGMALFFSERTKCNRCHAGPNFSSPDGPGGEYSEPTVAGTANVGLDLNYEDQGKANGKFRIPSLRNIALTGPYMHDGRFSTLKEVLQHYDKNIQPHTFLDDNLKAGEGPAKMNFTELEFIALEAFLNTLTDEDLLVNEKYSNPFRN